MLFDTSVFDIYNARGNILSNGATSEGHLKTVLPRKLTFANPDKIRELARRGEAWRDSESRQMIENGIQSGRGGIWLRLTPDQYRKLRERG